MCPVGSSTRCADGWVSEAFLVRHEKLSRWIVFCSRTMVEQGHRTRRRNIISFIKVEDDTITRTGVDPGSVITRSTLTCPSCAHVKEETMPTDACQFFYECEWCRALLRPKPGDCCVYCSYATVPCPPVQENGQAKCCG